MRHRFSIAHFALLCAVLLVASAVGPWEIPYQACEGNGWAISDAALVTSLDSETGPPFAPGPLGYTTWDRLLVPFVGLLTFVPLLSIPGAFGLLRHETRQALGWSTVAFAGAGLTLLVVTDVAQASLVLDGWASQVFGGYRPYDGGLLYSNDPYATSAEARRGWSWGAGIAFWSCTIGLMTCIIGWWLERRKSSFN